jgi:methyl-accepting chemotaxis protein
MTVSRKIIFLVSIALVTCVIISSVSLYGFISIETEIGHLAVTLAKAGFGDSVQSVNHELNSARTGMIVILFLGLSLLVTSGYLLLRSIARPLKAMEFAIARAADTLDFTESFQTQSEDEIGRTLQSYNRLLARLRSSFLDIQQSIAHLMEVTEEVDHSSRKIARNSQVQSDASSNMASAVEQMTVSISTVAEQASDASKYTQESHEIAERSAGVILSTVNSIQEISELVNEAATRIKALRVDCDSISSVAKMIHEIADQTNLLALNAAIEAARAGEQGRGFAVVADEVRKLAERTTLSTQEINALLGRMQDSARLAVESMSRTKKTVDEGVIHARDAGESIEKLKAGAGAAATVAADISGAMREQETASSAIAHNIEQIAQMSEQNSSAANVSSVSVGRMTQVGLEMSKALSVYKVESGSKKIILRAAFANPEGHPAVRAVMAMADMIAQRSQGRITLKVIAGGAFGAEKDILDQVKAGSLDIGRSNVALLAKDCPATVVPSLPYLFNSIDHMHRVMDGAPGQEILAACAQAGYIGLTAYDVGLRSIYSNKPIRSRTDLRDQKLRILQSELWMAIAHAMGAIPVVLPQDQVTIALRTGLIDCAENNILVFESYKHHDGFKYFCQTDHAIVPEILLFSKNRWDTLAPEDQSLIAEAARESLPIQRRLYRESEDIARKKVATSGTIFIKDVDKASFQNAMRPVYDKFVTSPQQKALFEAIKAMK